MPVARFLGELMVRPRRCADAAAHHALRGFARLMPQRESSRTLVLSKPHPRPSPPFASRMGDGAHAPVQTFFRTAPFEVDGVRLDEGRKVLLFLGAANRDAPRRRSNTLCALASLRMRAVQYGMVQ